MKRILSALILVPLVILLVLYAPLWLFTLAISLVSIFALSEFFGMTERAGYPCLLIPGYCSLLLIQLFQFWRLNSSYVIIVTILLILISGLITVKEPKETLKYQLPTFLGVYYVGYLLALLIPLKQHSLGHRYILLLFIIIWAGDTAAYYGGKTVGRHPLAPDISPKKTLEGSFAGVVGSVASALAFVHFWPLEESSSLIIVLAIVLNLFGQLGDLVESVLKRSAQIKDSSGLIPGHGGILDRIDSLLFSIPILYLYLAGR